MLFLVENIVKNIDKNDVFTEIGAASNNNVLLEIADDLADPIYVISHEEEPNSSDPESDSEKINPF